MRDPNASSQSASQAAPSACCESGDSKCCCSLDRRQFIQFAGAGAAALASFSGLAAFAGPFEPKDTADHFIPTDKKLKPEWVAALSARGQREFYEGRDLSFIGMPVGGITTGQVYLTGDGRLVHWDIFNEWINSGYGDKCYDAPPPTSPLKQGFAIRIKSGGKTIERTLDHKGFPGVRFCGEYPIGYVEYADKSLPVAISLEAFSPFIPLNAQDSALPATVMEFTVKNTSEADVEISLAGWIENGVCKNSAPHYEGHRINRPHHDGAWTMVACSAKEVSSEKPKREPIVFADFEGEDYAGWTVAGKAFGKGPANGTLPGQQEVRGFQGKKLVNTFLGGDAPKGTLTSPKFKIERRFISFLVGGGADAHKTCIHLLVDGKVVRTAAGKNEEKLQWTNWDVREFAGREAQLRIVDEASEPWGHINVDQIEFCDIPHAAVDGPMSGRPDFGTMGLAVLAAGASVVPTGEWPVGDGGKVSRNKAESSVPLDSAEVPLAFVETKLQLKPGRTATVPFVIAWHFPNRPRHGNQYAARFRDAVEVVRYVAARFERLRGETRRWHDTWYDSTLPYWLLDRLFSTTSILASSTCQWWANGRFWAWEGVGCCEGTCGHVWNYEHAMARLFPELERSVRIMQDYLPGVGFRADGSIGFRGENFELWAGDSQPGYVLKAYREHQMSSDDRFLKSLWPRVRKSLEFLIQQDGNADGLIEGSQHNTYDIFFFGPNTMVGSLYLAALRAGEAMADEMGDKEFAATCRTIFESGSKRSVEKLFNGEYFIQIVDLKKHPKHQYADGCLADQLFGQGWAHQVGLGYVYPQDKVRSALKAVWTYDWAPDVGPQNKGHSPQRWFARPGEAGLFTCTWPKSKHLGPESVLYRDEVWTGIEYQVAGNMIWDGMLTEGLAICRAVHDRYHPAKRNPWNEVECGDHYARAMASYGVFLALCGFEYHGPQGRFGFAPKITPEDFRGAFTTAEGWGTLRQRRETGKQINQITTKWGKLRIQTLVLELPQGLAATSAKINGVESGEFSLDRKGCRLTITFAKPVALAQDQTMEVVLC